MKRIGALFLALTLAYPATAQLTFDLQQTSHPFKGFGVQIWAGDLSVEPVLRDLHVKVVRMDLGKFTKKFDARLWGNEEFANFYAGRKWKPQVESAELLNKYNIDLILNAFAPLESWTVDLPKKRTLNPDFYAVYVKRIAAALKSMRAKGIHPLGIEPFNEPDGDWNCYVAPEAYNEIIPLLRRELDEHGLQEILILGPGLAHIDTYPENRWIQALDEETVAAMGIWSAHAYQFDTLKNQEPSSLREAYKNNFQKSYSAKDPQGSKPVYITEFSPLKVWSEKTHPMEGDAFAARSVENALSLLNSGAHSVIFWEAADQPRSPNRHHGLIRLDKSPRPVYFALQSIFSNWKPNSLILEPLSLYNNTVYAAATLGGDLNEICLSLVNSTAQSATETIYLKNSASYSPHSRISFADSQLQNLPLPEFSFEHIRVTLPPFSSQTLVFRRND